MMPGKEGVISGENQTVATPDRIGQAWHALRQDPSIQFNLQAPSPQPKPPHWLETLLDWIGGAFRPIGRLLEWIASFLPDAAYARILLWVVVGVAAAALLWALYNRIRYGGWGLRRPHLARPQDLGSDDEWLPTESGARSWLEEADSLAREGRFAEAIHHLLFRSIEDIANRRPTLVRPALTSRELAAAEALPNRARDLFSAIAGLVERSLFGGRAVGESDWLSARQAYSDFALPSAWRA